MPLFGRKKSQKGTRGKTARVKSPARRSSTRKSAKPTDVSMPISLVSNPTVAGISKYFSAAAIEKRKARKAKFRENFRKKAKKAIDQGINATAKIVDYGEKLAPVLLLGAGAYGAISPATVAVGMMGVQAIEATEKLIDHTVKEYNSVRTPTMKLHEDRAARVMNDATRNRQEYGLFAKPLDPMNFELGRSRVDGKRKNAEAYDLLEQSRKRIDTGRKHSRLDLGAYEFRMGREATL